MRAFAKSEEIGNMDARIVLQSLAQSVNGYGERVETWSTLATVWAQVSYNIKPSKEDDVGTGKQVVEQEVIFRIRMRSDVSEQNRISYDSRTYDIIAIEKTADRQFMLLSCKTVGL